MKSIHHLFACAVLALGLVGSAAQADETKAATPKQPNIVFILADDHCRQATSCYNDKSLIQTPNIDRLAKSGVRFNHALVHNSICTPARATMLTGKYNHLCGAGRLNQTFDGSQQTFPKLLQEAGYQTALIGKWHLVSRPTGFDHFMVLPHQGYFYNPRFRSPQDTWKNPGTGGHWEFGGKVFKGYTSDLITDFSFEWLEQRDKSKPFCLMIHHKAPHSPHHPAPRHKELYTDKNLPEPDNLLDDHKDRVFSLLQLNKRKPNSVRDNIYPQYKIIRKQYNGDRAHDTRLMYQAFFKGYLRLVAGVDENVGRVLDYLDEKGLSDNTLVIYSSDHGFFTGEHGFFNKMLMYEESLHVPFIVRAPGGLVGKVNNELVGSTIDLAPTLLDYAGVDIPEDIQGKSIRPLVEGKTAEWRDSFYYHYSTHIEIIGVRTHKAKLIYYPSLQGHWEYFDLEDDPQEMHNLYHDPNHQEDVEKLKTELRTLAEQYHHVRAVNLLSQTE